MVSAAGIGRVDEHGHDGRRGDQLVQQFQSLRRYLHVQLGHARDVGRRSVQAGDEADLHGIAPVVKTMGIVVVAAFAARPQEYWSRRSRPPCDEPVGRQRRQSIILAFRPAIFDRHVPALDIAGSFRP